MCSRAFPIHTEVTALAGREGGQGGGKNGFVSLNYNDLKIETRPSLQEKLTFLTVNGSI